MARNGENGCNGHVRGCVVYAGPPGSCHTSYNILGGVTGSLKPCWTNQSLVAFIIEQAKTFLLDKRSSS
jgi:hypothetical protein